MTRRHNIASVPPHDAQDALVVKARRLRAKGDVRKAVVALREACMRDESAAALWTLLGALEAKLGRRDDARRALKHAVWLRRNAGDAARERSTLALLERLLLPTAA